MKEKKIFKRLAIVGIAIVVAYLFAQSLNHMITDHRYTDQIIRYGNGYNGESAISAEDLEIQFSEEGVLNVEKMWDDADGNAWFTLHAEGPGWVSVGAVNKNTGQLLSEDMYTVTGQKLIVNRNNGNFSGFRSSRLFICLFFALISILLWVSFALFLKKVGYSYHAVFSSGLGVWFSCVTLNLAESIFHDDVMVVVYDELKSFAGTIIIYTAIPILIFAGFMIASNIFLIKREGFRRNNALGIIISALLILGAAVYIGLFGLDMSGSETEIRVFNALIGIYSCVFALLECFLIGSIICGAYAAKHEPKLDRDYIIILGCKVKEDGTLYPLIRGRVDRAISFYKKQLEKTGKKAILIPTGGKGRDENISEGEAMCNYILQQGVEASQIITEDKAKNTVENMKFSRNIIDERTKDAKVAFSTTNYHVFRSGIISRQVGFEPDGMGSKTKWYFWPNAYVREVIGMISYKWKTLIMVLVPIIAYMIVTNLTY